MSGHDHQPLHLACHQFPSREGRVLVCLAMQECSQIAAESHAHDSDRVVLLLGEQTAIEGNSIGAVGQTADTVGVERISAGILHGCHRIGKTGDSTRDVWLLHGPSHSYLRPSIPSVQQFHILARAHTLLVKHHSQDTSSAFIGILVEHIQSPCIVHIVTHIGLEDDQVPCLHGLCHTEEYQQEECSHSFLLKYIIIDMSVNVLRGWRASHQPFCLIKGK